MVGILEPGDGQSFTVFEGHHRELKGRLQRFGEAIGKGGLDDPAKAAEIVSALTEISSFAEAHFADEEKLMEDVEFPHVGDHRAEHRQFLDWMVNMKEVAATEPRRLIADHAVMALVDWWEAHAIASDRPLADFLCRGGI